MALNGRDLHFPPIHMDSALVVMVPRARLVARQHDWVTAVARVLRSKNTSAFEFLLFFGTSPGRVSQECLRDVCLLSFLAWSLPIVRTALRWRRKGISW
ncbi:hypothetical protein CDAR_548011 [Caerostris darwini]|uniref:Uncharacterized protein n=1 Tax=Caerostris darwini TaxID=1538125 RepID=A0AAV4WIG7_9ARAC|nr:hypothetical protein CDAR_548011 [Caerostris darwini]